MLDGQHVVIQGPPGTGKSQTIANVIAAAAAAGERVLFVTEKRAAIEAVTERLAEAGLAELVLDLHGKQVTRREVARQVSESLDRLSTALPPDVEDVHRALAASRKALVRHAAEKCEVRAPWGLSAHDVEQKLLGLPATARSEHLSLPRAVLQRLDRGAVDSLRRQLADFVALGGLALRRGDSAWSRAEIRDPRQAEELLLRLDKVTGRAWQQTRRAMLELVEKAGLPRPLDLAGWTMALTLMADVERAASTYGSDVHGPDLDRLCAAVGDRPGDDHIPPQTAGGSVAAFVSSFRHDAVAVLPSAVVVRRAASRDRPAGGVATHHRRSDRHTACDRHERGAAGLLAAA